MTKLTRVPTSLQLVQSNYNHQHAKTSRMRFKNVIVGYTSNVIMRLLKIGKVSFLTTNYYSTNVK